jgi:hypothetical protein
VKTRIHVNRFVIARNRKTGECQPPLRAKTYKGNEKAGQFDILVRGEVVASVVYHPEAPLSCGAVAWVETEHEVRAVCTTRSTPTGAVGVAAPCTSA